MKAIVSYSLLRFGLFAVVYGVLYAIDFEWWFAAIVASIVAFTVSYIFFAPLRARVAEEVRRRRERPEPDADAEAEDSATSTGPSSSSTAP